MKNLKIAGTAAAAGAISAIVLLFAGGWFIHKADAPERFFTAFGVLIAVFASVAAGAVVTIRAKGRAPGASLAAGAILCAFSAILSALPGGEKQLFAAVINAAVFLLLPTAFHLITMLVSSRSGTGRRRRKRNRRR